MPKALIFNQSEPSEPPRPYLTFIINALAYIFNPEVLCLSVTSGLFKGTHSW